MTSKHTTGDMKKKIVTIERKIDCRLAHRYSYFPAVNGKICIRCGKIKEEFIVEKTKLGDRNYSSGHTVNANGSCNMGCC